jgi:hypothetical protein
MLEAQEYASQLLWMCGGVVAWATQLQVGWRRFCAWLLQTTRALNRAGEGRTTTPPHTSSLLETVAQLWEGKLTSSLFDHQVLHFRVKISEYKILRTAGSRPVCLSTHTEADPAEHFFCSSDTLSLAASSCQTSCFVRDAGVKANYTIP